MVKVIAKPIYHKDEKTKKWKFRAVISIDGQTKDLKRRGFDTKKDAQLAYDELLLSFENPHIPKEEMLSFDGQASLEKKTRKMLRHVLGDLYR